MMTTGELFSLMPLWFVRAAAFAFGLLWGSFLNVVIYRVPREMSVVRPASHCPGCGKPVAPYDNVPVLSYVLLRGRARCCGARMSPRYPLVELIGGALSLAIVEIVVVRVAPSTSAARALATYGADFSLCLGLVAAAFIDAEHMFLPDSITLGGVVLGVATASLRDMTFVQAIVGAAVGFMGVWLPFTFLYKGLLGRTGMGMGDAKLVALAGAWFGWPGAAFALFAGAIQGTLYAAVLHVLGIEPKLPEAVQNDLDELEKAAAEGDEEAKRLLVEDPLAEDDDAFILTWLSKVLGREKKPDDAPAPEPAEETTKAEEEERPRARIPFGPFLILACLELMFFGDWIAARFGALLALD